MWSLYWSWRWPFIRSSPQFERPKGTESMLSIKPKLSRPSRSASRATTKFGVFLLTLVVSACENGVSIDACAGWQPIRPSSADVETMSDRLIEDILSHNEQGQRRCDWTP